MKLGDDYLKWTEAHVVTWMKSFEFACHYKEEISQIGVDGEMLDDITHEDLGEMGIKDERHQNIIVKAIRDLERKRRAKKVWDSQLRYMCEL